MEEDEIKKINATYKPIKLDTNVKINSADKVRLERFDENSLNSNDIYEFVLLTHMEKLIECSKASNNKAFHYYYYTYIMEKKIYNGGPPSWLLPGPVLEARSQPGPITGYQIGSSATW